MMTCAPAGNGMRVSVDGSSLSSRSTIDRVGVVGEVEESAHDPAGALGVEAVVVVAVQVVDLSA